ncbi:hypothetical protein FALCPG4_015720 [Fusarium falciforme]
MKLVEREALQERNQRSRVEYFTLSHVWGTDKFLTLTTENITRLKRQIEPTELPKCFQEAVITARRLGGRYLWIDSLCIMQDSPQDWAIESGDMHRVYSNGICNLATSNQSAANRGLFCSRNPAEGAPLTVEAWWRDRDHVERVGLYPNFSDLFTSYAPLYRRSWVAQEQELSPRTIHMAPFPIWECRQAILTECFPSQETFGLYKCPYATTKFVLGRNEIGLLKSWNWMIHFHSRCGLTKNCDKLMALCGIAKAYSQCFRSEYFAGIWGSHLLEGLLWRPIEQMFEIMERGETRRYTEYVAPSWSWASIKGSVYPFAEVIDVALADILSVETQPRNGDPFGQLCGGA